MTYQLRLQQQTQQLQQQTQTKTANQLLLENMDFSSNEIHVVYKSYVDFYKNPKCKLIPLTTFASFDLAEKYLQESNITYGCIYSIVDKKNEFSEKNEITFWRPIE